MHSTKFLQNIFIPINIRADSHNKGDSSAMIKMAALCGFLFLC